MSDIAKGIVEGARKATKNVWFHIFSVVGIVMLIASFFVPPFGAIDESVLKAGSLLFGFAALSVVNHAIIIGVDAKLTHGDTSVEVNSPDNNGEADG